MAATNTPPNLNMAPPFKCPDCPQEFPTYQARFQHRMREHGLQPRNPGQYKGKKGRGKFRCTELVNGKKCGMRYAKPQDLGKHKWFAHGIRGVHAQKRLGTHLTDGRHPEHVERPTAAQTFTQNDLQFEGVAAFTAGEVYATIRHRAEAADLPYGTLAERVNEFVRATTHGPKLGHTHRMPLLSRETSS